MSTTATRREPAKSSATGPQPADVFVVFGITGDLAKVMTFRSLYRLEQRGLLDCPIVGVAVNDWTVEHLREHARECDRGHRRAGRPEGVRPLRRAALVRPGRLRRRVDLRPGRRRHQGRRAPGLLPGDPAVPVRHGRRGAVRRPASRRRPGSWSRSRSATTSSRPGRSPPSCTSTSTSPSSTGSTTSSARWGSRSCCTCASRTRCSSRSGTATTSSASQITMAESFGVEDRGHFYDPVGALRDVVVNHLMQVVAARAMEAPAGGDPATLKDAKLALFRSIAAADPGPLRARPVRRLPRHRRRRRRLDHRDVCRAAAGHRQLALVGRAVLHPHRQAPAASRRPSCGSSSSTRRGSGSRT